MIIASNANNVMNDVVLIASNAKEKNSDIERYDALVNIKRIEDHNVIQIDVYARSVKDVRLVEASVIRSVLGDIEQFYVIDDNFSIKILGRYPGHKTALATISPYILSVVIFVGITSGVLALFYMVNLMREEESYGAMIDGKKVFEKYHASDISTEEDVIDVVDSEEIIDSEKDSDAVFVDEKEESVEEGVSEVAEDMKEEEKKIEDAVVKKSVPVPDSLPTTPGNLPVVDLENIGFAGGTAQGEEEQEVDQSDREPTEEELKARLNKLLSGKL